MFDKLCIKYLIYYINKCLIYYVLNVIRESFQMSNKGHLSLEEYIIFKTKHLKN